MIVEQIEEEEEEREFERLCDAEEEVEERIKELVDPHLKTLARKYHHLVYYDDYNNEVFDKFNVELKYFYDRVIKKDQIVIDFIQNYPRKDRILPVILRAYILDDRWDFVQSQKDLGFSPTMTGVEFERFIESKFLEAGMRVRPTPVTGDQGADLIVEDGHNIIVVQCKRSQTAIGNKAVQEVAAGRGFYNASSAWVVSDAQYTKSARILAQKIDVILLHYSDVDKFLLNCSEA